MEFGSQTYRAPVCMRPNHAVEPTPSSAHCASRFGARLTAAFGVIGPSSTC